MEGRLRYTLYKERKNRNCTKVKYQAKRVISILLRNLETKVKTGIVFLKKDFSGDRKTVKWPILPM